MRKEDFKQFADILDGVCSLLSRGAYTPNATNTALFFRALETHPIEAVRAGFDAHVRDSDRGRFVPTPADILAQIEGGDDGRPAADEAWAIAVTAADEACTVVWTDEISHAWGVAKPVLELGDEVGARMAFKAAYARDVSSSRAARVPIAWSVSRGHDAAQRDAVIAQAVCCGRIPALELPAPGPVAGLLELSQVRGIPAHVKDALERLKQSILEQRNYGPGYDFLAKLETEAAKRAQAEAVQRYTSSGGGEQ